MEIRIFIAWEAKGRDQAQKQQKQGMYRCVAQKRDGTSILQAQELWINPITRWNGKSIKTEPFLIPRVS